MRNISGLNGQIYAHQIKRGHGLYSKAPGVHEWHFQDHVLTPEPGVRGGIDLGWAAHRFIDQYGNKYRISPFDPGRKIFSVIPSSPLPSVTSPVSTSSENAREFLTPSPLLTPREKARAAYAEKKVVSVKVAKREQARVLKSERYRLLRKCGCSSKEATMYSVSQTNLERMFSFRMGKDITIRNFLKRHEHSRNGG